MKRLYTLLFLLLFVTACSTSDSDKDPNPATPSNGQISMASSSVKGYELAILQVEGHALAKQEYDLEIGSKKVKAVKNADNSLVFLVPGDLPTGIHAVKAEFAKNTLELTVTAPAPIADPVAYVEAFVGDPGRDVKEYKSLSGETTVPAKLVEAKKKMEEALQRFKALGPEDQLVTAQVVKANETFFLEAREAIDAFKSIQPLPGGRVGTTANVSSSTQGDCNTPVCHVAYSTIKVCGVLLLAKASFTGATLGAAVLAVAVGVDVGLSIITGKESFLVSTALKVIDTGFRLAYWAPNFTVDAVLDRAGEVIMSGLNMRTAAEEFRILKGESFTIQPKITLRTLSAVDANSSSTLVKSLVTALEKARKYYSERLGSPFGAFPSYVAKSETLVPKSLDEWEVKVLNNPAVTVTKPQGTASKFTIVFNSSSKGEQRFTLSVTYRNGVEEATKTLSAVLIPQRAPHAIFISSGNNQGAAPNKALPSPLKAKVTDVNGNVLEGIEVEWSVKKGGGSLSAAKSVTDAAGIAQVAWTLGGLGEQEVEALARRADGTPVAGAPVLFSAKALSECELGVITAPVITNVEFVCDASTRVSILVSFRANGSGVLIDGTYYGGCQGLTCYPVRLYFRNPGAPNWSVASNGYDARLKSGTVNAGVIEIRVSKGCVSGESAYRTMELYYPGYKWQIELMNQCDQRSVRYSFDT